jgi:hypothetical protein
MSLVEHARRELELCGQYREDPEFAASIVKAVEGFVSYGHSGGSAGVGIHMLNDLLQGKSLSPLTDDPAEWMHVGEQTPRTPTGKGQVWQSRRQSDAFSEDEGKTYYLVDDWSDNSDSFTIHTSQHKEN